MHPDLEKLLDLQAKDLILLATDVRLKGIADEIAGLDAALDRARADVDAARKRLADGITKREELEKVIESQRTLQEKRRTRIEQVKTAREVQALMTELDAARQTLARQESDWVKAAETTQQQEAAVTEAEVRLQALESDQGGERARLDEGKAEVELEREEARQARDASAATVERSLRMRYDRLWTSRTTTVVVPLRGDACGACHTAVPRNRRSQIRAGTHIDSCEGCGVILYPAEGV
ncbi:MAG TPA: C4-type zinc ribbon domain-containing protein [Gemmatimonadales bacterium]|nr:C4-type zinc ribbon domain-containing protein [Gemmatimonadales bacterium]